MGAGRIGLVLTGGGARAAYQVGALRALAELAPRGPMPFPVVAGISAGAINAVALACAAADFGGGVEALRHTWAGLEPSRIFRTGTLSLAATGGRWLRDLGGGGFLGGNTHQLPPRPRPAPRPAGRTCSPSPGSGGASRPGTSAGWPSRRRATATAPG